MSNHTLAELASVRMGATLRGRDATRPDPAGSFRLIQISDLDDRGGFLTQDFTRVSPREAISSSVVLRPDDILFPNRGARTTASLFEGSDSPCFVGAQFFIIRPSSRKVMPAYVAWLLRTRDATDYFDLHRRGSNVLTLQKGAMEAFQVPLPSWEIQHAIVETDRLHHHACDLESRLAVLRHLHLEETLINRAHRP
ncbi:restriction endonuclease subunit S [Luteolibacter flavescens]|uniref:Restriction endonuclease subunit S n=1 Tax=Luteolibacter flavescens TaxID=1859460 RepID=A0ABT3FHR6_9BACT|nr:restriction endonuclease subunit S [Luteolibacter flavescens]MCW1883104.1 restriction endonuclease subunit S [Luteolibacter flavescens]